jgi:hypothetical protein
MSEKDTWFEVEVLYMPTNTTNIEDDEDKDFYLQKLKLGLDNYYVDKGFIDLAKDPVMHLVPGYLVGDNFKKYFTTIIFESGNSVMASGKPEKIKKQLKEFLGES